MGAILGRKRAFTIGCVIYACGSLITALSPNLPVLLFGWSFLEGVGAALVMPAIVALVASNFVKAERPRAYGIVTAGGAIAVALGPLIGGLFTTYWSWRYVFVGEVLIIGVVLLLNRTDRRHAEGGRCAPRPRRHRALGPRAGPHRLRGVARRHVGIRAAQARRADVDRAVAGDLADPRWGRGAARVPRVGEAPARRRARRRCSIPRSSGSGCCAAGSRRSSSSTCSRPACSSRCRCSCRSHWGSRRSTPGCASCRSRSPSSSPRSASPSSSRRRRPGASPASAS